MRRPVILLFFCSCAVERPVGIPERWRLAHRTAVVPDMMETSRQRAGPEAMVERKGYLSWEIVSSRGTSECNVLNAEQYRCEPDLEVELPKPPPPAKFVGPLSPPPLPDAPAAVRKPLRP